MQSAPLLRRDDATAPRRPRCELAKHTCVMLKKQMQQKWRDPIWTLLECFSPLVFVALVAVLWSISAVSTIDAAAPLPLSEVEDFEMLPALLSAWNMKIVFTPDTPAVRSLVDGLTARYPGFNATRATFAEGASLYVPPLSSVLQIMADDDALDAYTRDIAYATPSHPAIYAAVSLTSFAPHWDYTLRMNTSASNGNFGPPAPSILLPQTTSNVNVRQRGVSVGNVAHYLKTDPTDLLWNYRNPAYALQTTCATCSPALTVYMPGFLSLQLAVDRYIIDAALPPASALQGAALVDAWAETYLSATSAVFAALPGGAMGWSPWGVGTGVSLSDGSVAVGDASVANALAEIAAAAPGFDQGAFDAEAAAFLQARSYAPQRVAITSFPATGYSFSVFYAAVEQVFGLFFVLSFFLPVFRFVRGVVAEKEQGQAELLATMGLRPGALLASWVVVYMVEFTISAAGVTLITTFTVFRHTDTLFIFALFVLFGAATVRSSFVFWCLFVLLVFDCSFFV